MKGLKDLEEKWIGTKETSEILALSESTVRRLCDTGKLACQKVSYNNYRKYKLNDVINFKSTIMNNDVKKEDHQLHFNLSSSNSQNSLLNITAKSHPSHYLMHKYWGRKPHNVIASYISTYSNPGERVLDPFAGSGITPIEAIKQNRIGIGVDINPMSKFIAENTISNVDLDNYNETAQKIMLKISKEYDYLYHTLCPHCKTTSSIATAIWNKENILRIRGRCSTHGIFIKDAEEYDIKLYSYATTKKKDLDDKGVLKYPTNEILKYVRRSGNKNIDDLFNDRALIILSRFKQEIESIDDSSLRNLLLFTFTSMLANTSNMLPGDIEKATYKSGWVISKFWTPKVHTERNIFSCFDLRRKAIFKGKSELNNIKDYLMDYYIQDSRNLNFLEDNSIDYILTDPPYGESIAYLGLSQFWNSWVFDDVDYHNEIIVDNYREKGYIDYSQRMAETFKELYRVLKPGKFLSFTFHNRDLSVWKSVMDAVKNADFMLVQVSLQNQAVNSGTQGINKTNTLTGDFIYTLKKPLYTAAKIENKVPKNSNNLDFIKQQIYKIITLEKSITPTKLYEILLPIIIENEAYIYNNKPIDIDKILKENYDYVEVKSESKSKLGDHYVWKLRN